MSRKSGTAPSAMTVTLPSAAISPFKNLQDKSKASWFRMEKKSDSLDVYIYDQIGGWFGTNAQDFVDQIKDEDVSTINLHLNSPGGSIFDGVAIYNALVRHQANVVVYVDALAASAASFIAQAGDEIIMSQGSMMMIHDGSALVYGPAKDMRDTADLLDKMSNNIAAIYADRAGHDAQYWRDFMLAETWYTAQEAVDASLADKVQGKATEDPEDHWDLSIFNYAGRSKAPSPSTLEKQFVNSVKEKPVTAPTNSGQQEQKSPAIQTPPATAPVAPAAPAAATVTAGTNQATPFTFMVNGQPVSDMVAVQQHISALEGFQEQTRVQNRKDFVAQLAKSNKIAASQIDGDNGVEAFALSLSTAQYESWVKTWDVAPVNPLFEKHSGGTTNHEGDEGNASKELADQIEVNLGIIKAHRDGGMKPEAIEKTASWAFLKQHNALPSA